MHPIQTIVAGQKAGIPKGIYSCCSANEMVLRAAIQRGKARDTTVLIEATANQVNQYGGYTGMRPADFYQYAIGLAREMGLPEEQLVLGGDHLGPLTWTAYKEEQAMERAKELVRQYAQAGFTKIHLDTSMRLADDSTTERLSDETIARRGAELCKVAEEAWLQRKQEVPGAQAPVYIIGSEVPIPGGAQEAEDSLEVTKPEDCEATIQIFQDTFARFGLEEAWQRVVGLVVQPGVEFGDAEIFAYDREKASALTSTMRAHPQFVLEGHSTDYQTPQNLKEMVEDGIAILKVGPALTFAYREGLLALEEIEKELLGGRGLFLSDLRQTLEYSMLEQPDNWKKHYHGDGNQVKFARMFSFSDRARYYLPVPRVEKAIERLRANLSDVDIPVTLLSQYLPVQYARVRNRELPCRVDDLLIDHIGDCIDGYLYATLGERV